MISTLDRYGFVPFESRPKIVWPNEARIAVWIAVNHEFYELISPDEQALRARPQIRPDILDYSHYDYGNRAGAWRVLELLDRFEMRATLSLNVAAVDHFPAFTEQAIARGWEIMSHGIYNTRTVCGLDEAAEREVIEDCLATIERVSGQRPKGWMGPLATSTERTLDLLAEYGFSYTLDLFHEDEPYPITVKSGRLISVPYTQDANDWAVFDVEHHSAETFVQVVRDQFDRLYGEGRQSGRVMCISLHPYLIGHPSRIGALERVLEHVASYAGVWLATAGEISDWYYAHYYDSMLAAAAR